MGNESIAAERADRLASLVTLSYEPMFAWTRTLSENDLDQKLFAQNDLCFGATLPSKGHQREQARESR